MMVRNSASILFDNLPYIHPGRSCTLGSIDVDDDVDGVDGNDEKDGGACARRQ